MENQVQAFLQPAACDSNNPMSGQYTQRTDSHYESKTGLCCPLKNTAQSQSFTETNRQLEDSPIYVQHPDVNCGMLP